MGNKSGFLLSLAREELTDKQIVDGVRQFYQPEEVETAKRDLRFHPLCCMTAALLAGEKLERLLHSKSPMPGSITGLA